MIKISRLLKGFLTTATLIICAVLPLQVQADRPLKVGFVYVSPAGGSGWTYAHDQARKHIESKFGKQVNVTVLENIAEGAEAERVIMQLAEDGNDLIFTTTFGYMNPTIRVAKRYPAVKFEHVSGYKNAENVSTYFDRIYEARYLTGVIAGHMSKTGTVAYVASFPIPEVIRGINAFTIGLQSVNPNAKVRVAWVNSWYAPDKEREAAEMLIQQGADIVTQHTDSPAPVQAAEAAGIYAIGFHSDMREYGKKYHLTAATHYWHDYYEKRIQQVMEGSWRSENIWQGFSADMTRLAPLNKAIPAHVVSEIEQLTKEISAGTLHPFTGPLYDRSGKEILAKGMVMEDKRLLGMNFYLQGIQSATHK